jgi:hypothetical protein
VGNGGLRLDAGRHFGDDRALLGKRIVEGAILLGVDDVDAAQPLSQRPRHQQNVREQDRGIHAKAADRLQGHLSRQLRS